MPMKPKSITDLILETVHTQEIVTPKVESFMLDYDYVEGCQHIATLVELLRILNNGTFGKYSDLESVVENKILALISDKDRNNILNQRSAFLESKNEADLAKDSLEEWVKSLDMDEQSNQVKSNNILPPVRKLPTKHQHQHQSKDNVPLTATTQNGGFASLDPIDRRYMAKREKEKGNEYFKEKNFEKALLCYSNGIELDDSLAVLFANRALVNYRLGAMQDALRDCNRALEIDPSYTKARGRRGTVYVHMNRFEEAMNDFKICMGQNPHSIEYSKRFEEAKNQLESKARTKITITEEEQDDDSVEEIYTPVGAKMSE